MSINNDIMYLDAVLGHIYEAGFKLGFLKRLTNQKHNKDLFLMSNEKIKNIIETVKRYNKYDLLNVLFNKILEQDYSKFIPYINSDQPSFYQLASQYVQNDNNLLFNTEFSSYVIGCWQGYMYAYKLFSDELIKKYKNQLIQFINFDVQSEILEKGAYQNADINFLAYNKENKLELHLYDIKFNYGKSFLLSLFNATPDKKILPILPKGVPLSISLGSNKNIINFAYSLAEHANKLLQNNLLEVDFDWKTLLQVFSYLFDYLDTMDEQSLNKIQIIKSGYLGGVVDGIVYSFECNNLSNYKSNINSLKKIIKSLYQKSKNTTLLSSELMHSKSSDLTSISGKIIQQLDASIDEICRYINIRDNSSEILQVPQTIDDLRKEVRKEMEDWFEQAFNPDGYKGLVLLHSTGAGKTTSARQIILGQEKQKILYLYFAPRSAIIEDEANNIKNEKYNALVITSKDIRNGIYKKENQFARNNSVINFGVSQTPGDEIIGIIKTATAAIKNAISKKIHNHIVLCSTTQSITNVQHDNDETSDTFRYLKELVPILRESNYKCVFIIDEITGSDNGFSVMSKFLEQTANYPDLFLFLGFDATLHSKKVFEESLREYMENGYIAPSLSIVDFEQNGEILYTNSNKKTIKIKIASGYSFPAKTVNYRERFIINNNTEDNNNYEQIAKFLYTLYIEEVKPKNEKLFVYIQDKDAISQISEHFNALNIKHIYITANSKSDRDLILKDDSDIEIVMATSTLSRGVSLGNSFTKVVIVNTHYNSPESNLAEEIQACARIRGIKDEFGNSLDHEVAKEIIKVFLISAPNRIMDEVLNIWSQEFINSINYNRINDEQVIINENDAKNIIMKEMYLNNIKSAYIYANVSKFIFKSFINPSSVNSNSANNNMIVIPLPQQINKIYIPHILDSLNNVLSSLSDFRKIFQVENNTNMVEKIIFAQQNIQDLYNIVSIRSIAINNIKEFMPPYALIDVDVISSINNEPRAKLMSILNNEGFITKLENKNPDIRKDIQNIKRILNTNVNKKNSKALIYVPILAILYEMADKQFVVDNIYIPSVISRANIRVSFSKLICNKKITLNKETNNSVKMFAIPISDQKSFGWLSGDYPKLSGEIIMKLLYSTKEVKYSW